MTSNMGSHIIQEKFENATNMEQASEDAKVEVLNELKQQVRPEFLNRIDEVVMFTPLSKNNILQIVDIQLQSVFKMLAQQNIHMEATAEAKEFLATKGFDPEFGARPVKRVVQKEVLNRLSKEILSGNVKADSMILLDSFNNELVFRNQQ